MKAEYYEDLALTYVQGNASLEERIEVFRLIKEDPEFRELLLQEVELAKQLSQFRSSPPPSIKTNVYRSVISTNQQLSSALTEAVLTPIYNASLPKLVSSLIINCQRSVCLNG